VFCLLAGSPNMGPPLQVLSRCCPGLELWLACQRPHHVPSWCHLHPSAATPTAKMMMQQQQQIVFALKR
jgi:hypothetical protein